MENHTLPTTRQKQLVEETCRKLTSESYSFLRNSNYGQLAKECRFKRDFWLKNVCVFRDKSSSVKFSASCINTSFLRFCQIFLKDACLIEFHSDDRPRTSLKLGRFLREGFCNEKLFVKQRYDQFLTSLVP